MFGVDRHQFVELVWDYYVRNGRNLPWRSEPYDAYNILVSEVMLQQTQVIRVIPKYTDFIHRFPTVHDLADAPLAEVLRAWNGLGYNRRAKYLHEAAKALVTVEQPWEQRNLVACRGIGHNTSAAVVTYAYNQPVAFIETNIRSVYIHHFFSDKEQVDDKEILPLVGMTLDQENPREWFWALMDYGSHLKTAQGNAARSSKHYATQSPFQGSKRQIRGQVLKQLSIGPTSLIKLEGAIVDDRLGKVLEDLIQEGLISRISGVYRLAE